MMPVAGTRFSKSEPVSRNMSSQCGEMRCTFREVRKRLGKAGAGGNLNHDFRNVDSGQPGHDSLP
jgi:hypothetical protein